MAVPVIEALGVLARAMQRLDVPLWRPPLSGRPLDELVALLSPLRLPAELAAFWTEVDTETLRIEPYPSFMNPDWAITSWTMRRDDFAEHQPLALVDVGYQSHGVMGVELDIADRPGGALYAWWVDDIGIYRCFDGLGDWIVTIASLLDAGTYDQRDVPAGEPPYLYVRTEQEWSADIALPGHYHLPVGVRQVVSYRGPDTWPAHWRQLGPK